MQWSFSEVFIVPAQYIINTLFPDLGIKKSDEDVEDLDEYVYCSIAVTKYL